MQYRFFWKRWNVEEIAIAPQFFLIATKAYNKMSSENLKLQFQADQKFMSSQRGVALFWDTWYVKVACICILHVCALLILYLRIHYKKEVY